MASLIFALVESDIGVDSLEEPDLALRAGLGSLEKATGVGSLDVLIDGGTVCGECEGSLENPNAGGGVFLGGREAGEGSLEKPNAGGGVFLSRVRLLVKGGRKVEASLDCVLTREVPVDKGKAGLGVTARAVAGAGSSATPILLSPARETAAEQRDAAPALKLRQ